MRGWQFAIAAVLIGAPCGTAAAQSATPQPQGAITPAGSAKLDSGRTKSHRAPQGARAAVKPKQQPVLIDTSKFKPSPNSGGGIGFTHGAITPGVGMTGGNAGGNNSNGRTATPAQGSSGSPNP